MTPSDPASPVTLGFPPVDHEAPDVDDLPRRTNRRSIVAHIFTTFVAGIYGLLRFQLEANQSGGGDVPIGWVIAAVVPILLIRFGVEVLRWRAFTFRVNEHRLVIDKGVLTRHHVVVPFDRVQQVDVNRRFIALLLGLAAIRIDTAGMGAHTSVQLRYLDPRSANGLRAFILSHRDDRRAEARSREDADRSGHDDGPAAPTAGGSGIIAAPAEETLLTLGPKRLVIAALTHHSFLVLLPAMLAATVWVAAVTSIISARPLRAVLLGVASAVFGGLVVLVVAQSLIHTVVRHWGFTLSHRGDDLHVRFGLTDQRHLTVPRRRIQHVEVIDNPLRRALGLVGVHLHSAASLSGAGPGSAGTKFEIPVMRRDELDLLLPLLVGDAHFHIPTLTPRPPIARRRAVLRRVALVGFTVLAPAVALRPGGFALLALAALGIPWGRAAHRRAGHAQTPAVVVVAHGVLQHRIVLVPRTRLQSTRTSSSPFQRRARLQTIHLDVARAVQAPSLFDMDAATADEWRIGAAAPPVPVNTPAPHPG